MLNPNVEDEIMKPIKNGEMRLVGTTSNGICMYVCMYACIFVSMYIIKIYYVSMYMHAGMHACR